MPELRTQMPTMLNYVVVLVAAAAAFVTSFVYYVVFGDQYAEVSAAAREAAAAGPQAWQIIVELVRSIILATVVVWLATKAKVRNTVGAVVLALALWIGFPVVLWTGAIVHEDTPVQLAAIHAGDWLVKLLVVASIVGLWPRRASGS
jgi:Protein of unknown function (DUF1761)